MFECNPVEVVDRQVEAWRARDAAAFASFYAPDAVVVTGPGADETLTGREAIESYYGGGFREMPAGIELTITNRIVSGEYVIDEETLKMEGFAGEAVVIYRVKGCLIARSEILPLVMLEGGAS